MDKYHNDVNKFWGKFRDTVIECGIPEGYADWYVRWGRIFSLQQT